ncbi:MULTISPECIES: transporter substrate-binding domain-containing protein [Bacillus]|uniref:transporter substrate-binding domain-containing protein n=1 Tax=Bacillus TaxID=1386 RepID=UPI000BB6A931|nr:MULTISPECIES: transporter substrate-binding domain-containing protein [Bacillus]
MKKWMKLFIVMSILSLVLAACGTNTPNTGGEEKKVLKMGTSADYPPFEFIDTANGDEIIGFDIDLAKAITKELGYEIVIEDIDFGSLITAMKSNQIDFILAGMTPTEERLKEADFTDIYFLANHMIVTKKDSNINSIEDLAGKTIGVQLGSIQQEEAEAIAEEIDVKIETRDRIPHLISEVKIGRVDAVIIEDTVMKGYLEKEKDLTGFILDTDEGGSAIALPKDSPLTAEFNRVLNEMKENGELEKLVLKWFGDGEE